MAKISNIKRPKLPDMVADRLAALIRAGDFAPDERLPTERDLCERFGVSRNAVREAINELRTRGLVTTRQGSGTVVTGDFHKPVRDLMEDMLAGRDGTEAKLIEMRLPLEVCVAELAAQRATEGQMQDMEKILDEFEAEGTDLKRCAELDVAFHQALCRAAHNGLFDIVLESLNELLLAARKRGLERSGLDVAKKTHRALLDAIRQRNADSAADCMREHMDVAMKMLSKTK